jgi:transposase InsO family protein
MYTINPNAPKARMNAVNMVRSGKGVRQVARYFGCSPGTITKWCRKAKLLNQRHVIPTESSRPHHSPSKVPESVADAIIAKRLGPYPRCGAVIQRELANEGIKVSASTCNRVLDRHGLLKKKSKWKRFWRNTPRPVPENPGDLVELDTIHFRPFWYRNDPTTWYIYTGIDVNSRTGFAEAVERIAPGPSLRFARNIQLQASFVTQCFQSDNGQEFGRYFTLNLGTRHRKIRKRKPNDNAHIEKFNRTLQEECINRRSFNTIEELNQCLREYLDYYNNQRLHMGINFQTPLQKLAQTQVLQTA